MTHHGSKCSGLGHHLRTAIGSLIQLWIHPCIWTIILEHIWMRNCPCLHIQYVLCWCPILNQLAISLLEFVSHKSVFLMLLILLLFLLDVELIACLIVLHQLLCIVVHWCALFISYILGLHHGSVILKHAWLAHLLVIGLLQGTKQNIGIWRLQLALLILLRLMVSLLLFLLLLLFLNPLGVPCARC